MVTIRVRAEDADSGINGEIYYSIAEETDQFAIHPLSGVLTLTRPLLYRQAAKFTVLAMCSSL
jgi:protocadherin Fat 1/2/3